MKSLLILRHARASRVVPGDSDHARPLDEQGRRDALHTGRSLLASGLVPEQIFCSSAVRAETTARLVIEAAGLSYTLRTEDRLYLASPESCLELLSALPDACGTVMLVGHNPGLQELVALLTGTQPRMRPSTLVRIDLPPGDWERLGERPASELVRIWEPRA